VKSIQSTKVRVFTTVRGAIKDLLIRDEDVQVKKFRLGASESYSAASFLKRRRRRLKPLLMADPEIPSTAPVGSGHDRAGVDVASDSPPGRRMLLLFTVGTYRWSRIERAGGDPEFPGDATGGEEAPARHAHANCIENLPVFMSSRSTSATDRPAGGCIGGVGAVARIFQSLVRVFRPYEQRRVRAVHVFLRAIHLLLRLIDHRRGTSRRGEHGRDRWLLLQARDSKSLGRLCVRALCRTRQSISAAKPVHWNQARGFRYTQGDRDYACRCGRPPTREFCG
jgi:hypothetical protein